MNDFRAYIKFVGIENEDGSVAIDKASKSLLALNRWSLKYQKEFYPNQKPVAIKLKAVKRKCSLLELLINSPPIQTGIYVTIGSVAWKQLGFHEFCKKFMGTLGEQIALKKILKNDQPKSISKPYLKKNKIMVDLETKDGKKYSCLLYTSPSPRD